MLPKEITELRNVRRRIVRVRWGIAELKKMRDSLGGEEKDRRSTAKPFFAGETVLMRISLLHRGTQEICNIIERRWLIKQPEALFDGEKVIGVLAKEQCLCCG